MGLDPGPQDLVFFLISERVWSWSISMRISYSCVFGHGAFLVPVDRGIISRFQGGVCAHVLGKVLPTNCTIAQRGFSTVQFSLYLMLF